MNSKFPKKALWIENPTHEKNVISFKKLFEAKSACDGAVLTICGLGFYEAYLNGSRISEEYFKPLFTDYEPRDSSKNPSLDYIGMHTVTYDNFDITHLLKDGQNELVVLVGNGYYRNDDKEKEPFVSYGDKKLIFEISDKHGEVIAFSDESTVVAVTSRFSDLFLGDRWDFSKEEPLYKKAALAVAVKGDFVRGVVPNDKVDKALEPISEKKIGTGILYDFGINHSGGLFFSVKGNCGSKLLVSFAEVTDEFGNPDLSTGRWTHFEKSEQKTYSIDQKSEYILSGQNDAVFPLFCWHCYRYAYLECSEKFEISDMKSLFIHTDLKRNGFRCSDEKINKIYNACVLTLQDNLHGGVLTDCPHREKRAYTGDGQIVSEAMLYEFDAVPFYKKCLVDILCAQRDNGYVPNSAPYMSGGGGYAWGNAIVEIPNILFEFTGDKDVILSAFDGVEKWIKYMIDTVVDEKSNDYGEWLLGDWLSPGYTSFDHKFMSMLCLYRACERASFFARVIGENKKEKHYIDLSERFKAMINAAYFDSSCNYSNGIQGENVLPLHFGIVPSDKKSAVANNLQQIYEANNFKIDTGIVCTKYLFETLIENGLSKTAYKILIGTDYPSFLNMLDGETTISEHWSKKWPDHKRSEKGAVVKGGASTSHCHPMFCSVLAVFYKYIAGLDLSELYRKKIVFNFVFVNEQDFASAENETVFGVAGISWNRVEKHVTATLTIPKGVVGEIRFGCEIKNFHAENGRDSLCGSSSETSLREGVWNLTFDIL